MIPAHCWSIFHASHTSAHTEFLLLVLYVRLYMSFSIHLWIIYFFYLFFTTKTTFGHFFGPLFLHSFTDHSLPIASGSLLPIRYHPLPALPYPISPLPRSFTHMINSRNCCQGYGVSETPQGGLVALEICPQSS